MLHAKAESLALTVLTFQVGVARFHIRGRDRRRPSQS